MKEKRQLGRIQELPKVFRYPQLSQERVKLRTSNLAVKFTVSIRIKSHSKLRRKGSVGVSRDCRKLVRDAHYYSIRVSVCLCFRSLTVAIIIVILFWHKKAVLSQSWPRHAPYIWMPTATFTEIVNELLLQSIVGKCVQNLKFVRSFTRSWDNRGYFKTWVVSAYAHAPFSPKFLNGPCSDGPCECTGQIWSP